MTDHIESLRPDPKNPRRHTPRNVGTIAKTMQRVGFGRPILISNDNQIIAGHATIEAAGQIGIEKMRIVEARGDEVIALKRVDVEGGSAEAVELGVADNRSSDLSDGYDPVLMRMLDEDYSIKDLGLWNDEEWKAALEPDEPIILDDQDKYATAVETPLYTPTGERPPVHDLANTERHDILVAAIDASTVPADVKRFLRLAAQRHVVFDYRRIAEFYAHADAETQRLIEDSALVIIDVNRAIELGYARLRETLLDLREEAIADG